MMGLYYVLHDYIREFKRNFHAWGKVGNNVKKIFLTVFFKVRLKGKLQTYVCLSTQRPGKDREQPAPGRKKGHTQMKTI